MTVPSGVEVPESGVTAAVKVTGWPKAEGLTEEETLVVVPTDVAPAGGTAANGNPTEASPEPRATTAPITASRRPPERLKIDIAPRQVVVTSQGT
jgi:hypothetical protein